MKGSTNLGIRGADWLPWPRGGFSLGLTLVCARALVSTHCTRHQPHPRAALMANSDHAERGIRSEKRHAPGSGAWTPERLCCSRNSRLTHAHQGTQAVRPHRSTCTHSCALDIECGCTPNREDYREDSARDNSLYDICSLPSPLPCSYNHKQCTYLPPMKKVRRRHFDILKLNRSASGARLASQHSSEPWIV